MNNQLFNSINALKKNQNQNQNSCISYGTNEINKNSITNNSIKIIKDEIFYDKSQDGLVGLENLGATCYLNSLLQILYMNLSFRAALMNWKYDQNKHGKESTCVTFQLQRLFARLELTEKGVISTSDLTKSFGWTRNELMEQQDIQEMQHILFDFLINSCGNDTELYHFLKVLHKGELIDYVICENCNNKREKNESFLDLSLQVSGHLTLNSSIEKFNEAEILQGVFCSVCNLKTISKK